MISLLVRTSAVMALIFPLLACAGVPAQVEIYDRSSQKVLPMYWHKGQRHVAGEPGHEYEIRIRNQSGGRLLAVTSVDGVNVLDGRTASTQQGGYVLDPRGRVGIEGWRKSLSEVAAFYFTSLPDSYAARTHRPDNVGVIGVALYREKLRPQPMPATSWPDAQGGARNEAQDSAAAPASRSAKAMEERLGTGHGQRVESRASYTEFERASETPDAVISIFYDSQRNLLAQGIIPKPRFARHTPEPFPCGFVPDP